jgi:hypothetical protein
MAGLFAVAAAIFHVDQIRPPTKRRETGKKEGRKTKRMPEKERISVEEWFAIKTYKYEVQKPRMPSQQRWAAVTSNSKRRFHPGQRIRSRLVKSRGGMSKLRPKNA